MKANSNDAQTERKMVGREEKVKLEDLDFLNKDNIKMKDPKKVEFMLNVSSFLYLIAKYLSPDSP